MAGISPMAARRGGSEGLPEIRFPVAITLKEQIESLRRTQAELIEQNAPWARKGSLLKVQRFAKGKSRFTVAEAITHTQERPGDVKAALRKMLYLGQVSRSRAGHNTVFLYRSEA